MEKKIGEGPNDGIGVRGATVSRIITERQVKKGYVEEASQYYWRLPLFAA